MRNLSFEASFEHLILKSYRKELWAPFIRVIDDYGLLKEGEKVLIEVSSYEALLGAILFNILVKHSIYPFKIVVRLKNATKDVEALFNKFNFPESLEEEHFDKIVDPYTYDDLLYDYFEKMIDEGILSVRIPIEGKTILPLYLIKDKDIKRAFARIDEKVIEKKRKSADIASLIEDLREEKLIYDQNIFASLKNVNLEMISRMYKNSEYIDFMKGSKMMKTFDPKDACEKTINWIRDFFRDNGPTSKAVIGISGGKDSTLVGKLLVEALGKDRVVGVIMPNGVQNDIEVAREVIKYLGIFSYEINIKMAYDAVIASAYEVDASNQSMINLAPRLRMATLYYVSQSLNGRVANTCNASEDYVGYSTLYGDAAGDFSPISSFVVKEVKAMSAYLGIPEKFYNKVPSDGLSGKTDEDNLGFSYEVLDKYIREGIIDDLKVKERIDKLHKQNLFKLRYMASFKYQGEENA